MSGLKTGTSYEEFRTTTLSAHKSYDEIVATDARLTLLYNRQYEVLAKMEDHDFDQTIDWECYHIHIVGAEAYRLTGKLEKALKLIERCFEFQRDHWSEVVFAAIKWQFGARDEARAVLETLKKSECSKYVVGYLDHIFNQGALISLECAPEKPPFWDDPDCIPLGWEPGDLDKTLVLWPHFTGEPHYWTKSGGSNEHTMLPIVVG